MSSLMSLNVGYLLTEHLDNEQQLEITFFPPSKWLGKEIKSAGINGKTIVNREVDAGDLIKLSLDEITSLFLQAVPQLCVTTQKDLENKFFLKQRSASSSVKVLSFLLIAGNYQDKNFEIRIHPFQSNENCAYIGKDKIQVDLGPFEKMTPEQLKQAINISSASKINLSFLLSESRPCIRMESPSSPIIQPRFHEIKTPEIDSIKTKESKLFSLDLLKSPVFFAEAKKDSIGRPLLSSLCESFIQKIKNDPQIKDYAENYIEVNAKESVNGLDEPLSAILERFIASDQPVFALQGDGGMGKTLSMKIMTINLLSEYYHHRCSFFPIYIPLAKIQAPFEKLIEESLSMFPELQQYNVSVKSKDLPLLWIFDGYDEIDFNTTSNIYDINHIRENFPMSKTIFLSRREMTFLNKFKPAIPGFRLKTFFIQPLNKDKINQFVAKYYENKQKKFGSWNAQKFLDHFKFMDSFKWNSIMSNPFLLKVTMDVLPKIIDSFPQSKIDEYFKGQEAKVISRNLFIEYACESAKRASEKIDGKLKPGAFLEYAAKLAAKMAAKDLLSIPRALTARALNDRYRPDFEEFFEDKSYILYMQMLVNTNDSWSFIHSEYLTFFSTLWQDPKKLAALVKRCDDSSEKKEGGGDRQV